ncbi:unnamed protein product [Amoebophrya sp. A120]|nr:unnamed protein product [Amoebophrya sp. A120]|eukprot:GSA120T00012934001.1
MNPIGKQGTEQGPPMVQILSGELPQSEQVSGGHFANQFPVSPLPVSEKTGDVPVESLSLYARGVEIPKEQLIGASNPDAFYNPGQGAMPPPPDRTIYAENKNARYFVWGLGALGVLLIIVALIVGAVAGWRSAGFWVLLSIGCALVALFLVCVLSGLG